MTMHLVRGMSSINTRKRKQKGITQADRDAKVEHDKWLRERGLHPEQLKAKLPTMKKADARVCMQCRLFHEQTVPTRQRW